MAAGLTATLTKAQFDSQVGNVVSALDGVMLQIQQLRTYITGAGGGLAGLEVAPLSYSVSDATDVFNTFADLDQLRQIYQGLATLGSTKDFRTNAAKIAGTLVH